MPSFNFLRVPPREHITTATPSVSAVLHAHPSSRFPSPSSLPAYPAPGLLRASELPLPVPDLRTLPYLTQLMHSFVGPRRVVLVRSPVPMPPRPCPSVYMSVPVSVFTSLVLRVFVLLSFVFPSLRRVFEIASYVRIRYTLQSTTARRGRLTATSLHTYVTLPLFPCLNGARMCVCLVFCHFGCRGSWDRVSDTYTISVVCVWVCD